MFPDPADVFADRGIALFFYVYRMIGSMKLSFKRQLFYFNLISISFRSGLILIHSSEGASGIHSVKSFRLI